MHTFLTGLRHLCAFTQVWLSDAFGAYGVERAQSVQFVTYGGYVGSLVIETDDGKWIAQCGLVEDGHFDFRAPSVRWDAK